jgi:hypothetical protein
MGASGSRRVVPAAVVDDPVQPGVQKQQEHQSGGSKSSEEGRRSQEMPNENILSALPLSLLLMDPGMTC